MFRITRSDRMITSEFNTLLHFAAEKNDVVSIKILLSLSVDVNVKNELKETPLHLLTYNNKDNSHAEAIELLLKSGAEVNSRDFLNNTPLHCLVKNSNDVNVTKLLLKFNADPNSEDKLGQTPLHAALLNRKNKNNMIEVARLLIGYSSNVNAIAGLNISVLHSACFQDKKVFKLLIKAGAKVDVPKYNGCTPLMEVLKFNPAQFLKTPKFFLNYFELNSVDYSGCNLLTFCNPHKPDSGKKGKVAQILLEHFAKLQARDISLNSDILNTISSEPKFNEYFQKCTNELLKAKDTKLKNCWVTYFNLLVDNKRRLKNYAGNEDLVNDFKSTNCYKKFPIYGCSMVKKMKKGLKTRKLFDESAILLSGFLPIFNPEHLIIRGVLDCLRYKDFSKFCEKKK